MIQSPRRLTGKKAALLCLAGMLVLVLGFASAYFFLTPKPKGQQHYLLLGKDGWGKLDGSGRTDTILLATLDFDREEVLLTSFLRDTQVDLPGGKGTDRINTIAQYYGDDALETYIENTYGIDIKGSVAVNFTSMVYLIDGLGGITVNLSAEEAWYIKKTEGDWGLHPIAEGDSILNGAQALCYMRCRALDSDVGRVNRQAKAMSAVMERVRTISLGEVVGLLGKLATCYRTDMSLAQQTALVKEAFTLRNAPLTHHQVPAEGTYKYGELRGNSVLKINQEKNVRLLRAFLGLPEAFESLPVALPEGE